MFQLKFLVCMAVALMMNSKPLLDSSPVLKVTDLAPADGAILLLIIWLVAFVLSSCSSIPPTSKPPGSVKQETDALARQRAHQASIASLHDFSIDGRIGIQAQGHGLSGKMDWQHWGGKNTLAFYSPLGGKIASVVTTETGITLTTGDNKVYSAADAETLTEQTLCWRMPVRNLEDWIVGRPNAAPVSDASWDDAGKLTKLTQDGWEIEYLSYTESNGYTLPSKLNLRNPKLFLKLVIDRWQLSPKPPANAAP